MKEIDLALKPGGASVNPLIFGNFIEFIENCIDGGIRDPKSAASDDTGIRLDVLEKAKALRPTMLRWPGGTYTAIYHWMDSIGPMDERKKRRNYIWGGVNDGAFGTADFIKYCRELGCEPMICVNMASGTAQEAADWVEYCNGEPGSYFADLRVSHGYPEPFNVKYWCIGNECYAEPDLGPQHNIDRYIADAWEFTKHMKLTDPSIKLVFVGDTAHDDWNRRVLESLGPVCDYFSIHHYSGEGGKGEYGPFASLKEFDETVEHLIPMIDEYSNHKGSFNMWYRFPGRQDSIKLIVDEWNIWNAVAVSDDNRYGLKMRYNWRDALWTACMMNLFTRKCKHITAANLAQLVNVLAPIMTDGDRSYVQTTYHPLKLYRDMLSGEMLTCSIDSPVIDAGGAGLLTALDISAVKVSEKQIRVFAINLSKNESLRLKPGFIYSGIKSRVLTAPSFDSVNTNDAEFVSYTENFGDSSLELKPASINVIVFAL